MIIVKTKNGDRFINDKAVIMVEHDREKAVVNAHGDKGLYYHIEDVEGVIYTNDAQPTSWEDEGSALAKQDKELSEARKHNSDLRAHCMELENEKNELNGQIRDLKEEIRKLTSKPAETPDRWWPDDVDIAPISNISRWVRGMKYDQGYEVRLEKIFESNDIKTVGDLLRIGRRDFRRYRSVGTGSITRIDDALEDLYDIKGW